MRGRSMLVKRLKPIPVEAVVRGYLAGSGWKEYQETQPVCGVPLPPGLQERGEAAGADLHARPPRPRPATTTRTSASSGWWRCRRRARRADPRHSIRLYSEAAAIALAKGIIIADTKFEFGLDDAGTLMLMDEVLTPDSSRFWPARRGYRRGANPPSYDKQFVRDWLESGAHRRQALEQDAAGAGAAAGRDREDGGEVPRSRAERLTSPERRRAPAASEQHHAELRR